MAPSTLYTYVEKVGHMAGRLISCAPTIAKMLVAVEDLVEVGVYDTEQQLLTIQDSGAVVAWAGTDWWHNPARPRP